MALGAGLAFFMAVSLAGCEMDRMDQEADQPLFVETRRSYDGEWQDQRCLLRSHWDGLYVPVDGWDTLKDGLDQYNAEVSQETGERFKESLSLVRSIILSGRYGYSGQTAGSSASGIWIPPMWAAPTEAIMPME